MDLSLLNELTFWQKYYLIGIAVGIWSFVYYIGELTDMVRPYFKEFIDDCMWNIRFNIAKSKAVTRRFIDHEEKRQT